jgi:hypothetical protein
VAIDFLKAKRAFEVAEAIVGDQTLRRYNLLHPSFPLLDWKRFLHAIPLDSTVYQLSA